MVENELPFLSWAEFRQMAPPILRLEVRRLEDLICAGGHDVDFHNALVRARFEIEQCIACLDGSDRAAVENACAPHLRAAMLALLLDKPEVGGPAQRTLAYVTNRLHYILGRMPLLY